jgi:hypothetical protein
VFHGPQVGEFTTYEVESAKKLSNQRVQVWTANGGHEVGFAPDGAVALVSHKGPNGDLLPLLVDTETGVALASGAGHERPGQAVAISGDGRTAASADESGRILFWDLTQQ